MKRYLCAGLLSSLIISNLNAYDNYLKTSILYTVPNDLESTSSVGVKDSVEMRSGYAIEAAIGEKLSKEFTIEAQYSYDKANVKGNNSNIKVHSLFLNGIYNINIDSKSMHPYIGLGVGVSVYGDGTTDDTVLAYQGFAGVSFDTDYNIETFVEYKYKDFMDVMLDNISYDDTGIHSLGAGIKSKF